MKMPAVSAMDRRHVRVIVRVRPSTTAETAGLQCCTVLNHVRTAVHSPVPQTSAWE